MSTPTVSSKGWVVIPSEIRKRYGIKPGDRIQLVDYGGLVALVPALPDPILQSRGILGGGPSLTKALLEERQAEKESEEAKLQPAKAAASG